MAALYRNFHSRLEIDNEYNVEIAVPDRALYLQEYAQSSAAARRHLDHAADIRYGATIEEYVDIFPATRKNAPVLIFLHGGYWRGLSAKEFSFVAKGPQDAGVTTVVVNYALCPKVTMDEIIRQIRAAIHWTYSNIADFNGDPERLYVSGHSAGGHLTAIAMLTDWQGDYDLPRNVIKGGICISGIYDLTPLQYSFLQEDIRLDRPSIDRNSPIYNVGYVQSQLLITYGEDETSEFCRQSEDFRAAWMASGNKSRFLAQPRMNHFTAISGFKDRESPLCGAIFRLMNIVPQRLRQQTQIKTTSSPGIRVGSF
jgi:arylformamidase